MKLTLDQISKHNEKVRTTTAPYFYTEDGEEKSVDVDIVYRDLSIRESREIQDRRKKIEESASLRPIFDRAVRDADYTFEQFKEDLANAGDAIYLSDLLAPVIVALPWVVDDDGNQVEITREVLDNFPARNLQSIMDAIGENNRPKSKTARSGRGS